MKVICHFILSLTPFHSFWDAPNGSRSQRISKEWVLSFCNRVAVMPELAFSRTFSVSRQRVIRHASSSKRTWWTCVAQPSKDKSKEEVGRNERSSLLQVLSDCHKLCHATVDICRLYLFHRNSDVLCFRTCKISQEHRFSLYISTAFGCKQASLRAHAEAVLLKHLWPAAKTTVWFHILPRLTSSCQFTNKSTEHNI